MALTGMPLIAILMRILGVLHIMKISSGLWSGLTNQDHKELSPVMNWN